MIRLTVLTGCIFIAACQCKAQDVHIEAGAQEGNGLLLKRNGACFVVTPRHVVAAHPADIKLVGKSGLEGSASLFKRLGPDMVLLRVSDSALLCQTERWPRALNTDSILEKQDQGLLLIRDASGSRDQVRISISGFSDEILHMASISKDDVLAQGMSGGIVQLNNSAIGILVNVQDGKGTAIRIDELNRALDSILPPTVACAQLCENTSAELTKAERYVRPCERFQNSPGSVCNEIETVYDLPPEWQFYRYVHFVTMTITGVQTTFLSSGFSDSKLPNAHDLWLGGVGVHVGVSNFNRVICQVIVNANDVASDLFTIQVKNCLRP